MKNETIQVVVGKVGENLVLTDVENKLETFQGLVNGWIEAVRITDTLFMYCNEEHKLVNDPMEKLNIVFADNTGKIVEFISDDVVFVSINEEGDTEGVSFEDYLYLLDKMTIGFVDVGGKAKKVNVFTV